MFFPTFGRGVGAGELKWEEKLGEPRHLGSISTLGLGWSMGRTQVPGFPASGICCRVIGLGLGLWGKSGCQVP